MACALVRAQADMQDLSRWCSECPQLWQGSAIPTDAACQVQAWWHAQARRSSLAICAQTAMWLAGQRPKTTSNTVADCDQLGSSARKCPASVAVGHSDAACFHINFRPHTLAGFQTQRCTHSCLMHILAFCRAFFNQGLVHTSAGCCEDGPSVGAASSSWGCPSCSAPTF